MKDFTVIAFKPVATVLMLIVIKLMDTVQKVVKPDIGKNYVTLVTYLTSINLIIPSTTCDIVLVCVNVFTNVATLTGVYKVYVLSNIQVHI